MTPLKIAIVLVMILMVVSLIVAGIFLSQDKGKKDSKRVLYALGLRVSFAVILIVLAAYGILSGQLQSQAPWSYAPITNGMQQLPSNNQ